MALKENNLIGKRFCENLKRDRWMRKRKTFEGDTE